MDAKICSKVEVSKTFIYLLKHMPYTDDPPHRFSQFFFFDFINKIEIYYSIHIKGR